MKVTVPWRFCPPLPHLSSLGIDPETDGRGRRMTSFRALGTYYLPVTVLMAVMTRGQAPARMELLLTPVRAGGAESVGVKHAARNIGEGGSGGAKKDPEVTARYQRCRKPRIRWRYGC